MNKIVLLLLTLLFSNNCFAQSTNHKERTLSEIAQPTQPKEIGMRIFELYRTENFDSLVYNFFPTQDIFLSFCEKTGNIKQNDSVYQTAKKNFHQIEKYYLEDLIKHEKVMKEHEVDHESMKVDSIKYKYKTNEKVGNAIFPKLLYITVYCKDKNQEWKFNIDPLYYLNGKWFLLETDLGFSIRSYRAHGW